MTTMTTTTIHGVCCHDAGKDVDDAIVLTEGVSRPAT